ncbi:MAG: hypothetical protein R2828_13445 [Saprospiraceae bacterium]
MHFKRTDGTATWTKLRPGLEAHDLAHYVIETVLGYKNAFYGLINQGYEVGDFELPREQRPEALIPANIPLEAIQTEYIVNQLQTEYLSYGQSPDFVETLAAALKEKALPFPSALTLERLEEIRMQFRTLLFQWHALNEGDELALEIIL